jgi:hypothetical protein
MHCPSGKSLSYFQNTFQNVPAIAICQQLWQCNKVCTYHFDLFPLLFIHLPGLLQSGVGQILLHLWRTLCRSDISFSTYELFPKIPYQTHERPPFRENGQNQIAEFCAKSYISSNLFNILNPFPQPFSVFTTVVNNGLCQNELKDWKNDEYIRLFESIIIIHGMVRSVIVLWYNTHYILSSHHRAIF